MRKTDQYVVYSARRGTEEIQSLLRSSARAYRLQRKKNCDILPGLLDLPSGPEYAGSVDRLLKIWALFFDHVIIPDGWMHCKGPLSEYLRSELAKSRALYELGLPETFEGNTLFRLMRAGVIVPGLRGRRASGRHQRPLGYDLYRVWAGVERDADGTPVHFGVHYSDPSRRMTILDPKEDNNEIISGLAGATTLFVDWTSPDIPVDAANIDDMEGVQSWDRRYADEVFKAVLFDDSQKVRASDIDQIAVPLDLPRESRVKIESFYDDLLGRVQSAKQESPLIRRGRLELIVAQMLGLTRFTSYGDLDEIDATSKQLELNRFHSDIVGHPVYVEPRIMLARNLLDVATTVQETLFSEKFNCSPSMPSHFSDSVYYGGLAERASLETVVETFRFEEIVFWQSPIPFESIPVDTILSLREHHAAYFDAASTLQASGRFWKDASHFREELADYLKAIALKAPSTGVAHSAIDAVSKGSAAEVGTVIKGLADEYGAGLLVPGYGWVAHWLTKKAVSRASKELEARMSTGIKRRLQQNIRLGRYHMTMQLLGIPSDDGRIDRRPM